MEVGHVVSRKDYRDMAYSNLVPICHSCNQGCGSKNFLTWWVVKHPETLSKIAKLKTHSKKILGAIAIMREDPLFRQSHYDILLSKITK